MVKVLVDICKRGFDVKAVLAGEGRMRAELEQLAQSGDAGEQVVFAGNLGQEALSVLFPAAGVVVSPHTGRALTEAALGAAAVVAYDVDWQGELITTGETGVLVPHGDVEAMGNAVFALLSDPARAKSMGRALRSRALEMLDPEALDEHERQEYSKLLARFRGR